MSLHVIQVHLHKLETLNLIRKSTHSSESILIITGSGHQLT